MSGADPGHPRELLSAYLDDELGIDERAAVDRHLALCDPCRRQLRSLRALAAAVGDEAVPEVPGGLARRIGARLDEGVKASPPKRRYFLPASIAATIGAVGLLLAIQWRERGPAPPPAAPPEL
jgi:anti-sigma factor RsiW